MIITHIIAFVLGAGSAAIMMIGPRKPISNKAVDLIVQLGERVRELGGKEPTPPHLLAIRRRGLRGLK